MPKKQEIQSVQVQKDILTKEQKKFNSFIKKVKELKLKIELGKEKNQWLLTKGMEIIAPEVVKEGELEKELVRFLDNSEHRNSLSKKLREKLDEIVVELLNSIMNNGLVSSDDMIPIYEKYSEKSYEEEIEEQKNQAKDMMFNFAKDMFGVDLEDEDIENFGTFEEAVKAKTAAKEAEEEANGNKRQKTAKQAAAAEAEKELEKKLSQSTKQIYMQLVKEFHPDKAKDEEDELRRTEILQNLNNAYAADDLLALLEMQISLINTNQYDLTALPDATLKLYNTLLKRQVEELQQQEMYVNPNFNGNPFSDFNKTTEALSIKAMKRSVEELMDSQNRLKYTLKSIRDVKGFKEFVKNFQLWAAPDLSDIFQLLGRM